MRFIEMKDGDTCGTTRIDLAGKCEMLILRTPDQDEWAFNARPKRQLVGMYDVFKVEYLPELLASVKSLCEFIESDCRLGDAKAIELVDEALKLIEATGPWEVHQLNEMPDLDCKGNEK